jgi:uncharacterized damage-inducible protein DinB
LIVDDARMRRKAHELKGFSIIAVMTNPEVVPPLAPDELVSTGTEREILEAFLELHRGVVKRKISGLSEGDARRSLVPSLTTLAGLLKHLSAVERNWFQRTLARRSPDAIEGDSRGADNSWAVADDESTEDLIAEYDEACSESRRVAAGLELEDSVPHARLGRVSLRWVYVHMIEETARHAGHADILREQIDGSVGVDG